MSLIPVGFAEVTAKLQPVAGTRICTWSLGVDDELFPSEDPASIAQTFYDILVATGGPYRATALSSDWKFLGVHCTVMQEVGPISADFDNPVTGTATAAQVPINSTLLVNKTTGIGSRRNRGRCYPPATMLAETQVNSLGQITATLSGIQAYFTHIMTGLSTALLQPVLFHQSPPFTPTPITALTVQPLLATQRRRMRR